MSRSLLIKFTPEQDSEQRLIHRLQNFGEDTFRFLRENEWGEISFAEIDRATTHFSITNIKASKLRRLTIWVEQEALRQNLHIALEKSWGWLPAQIRTSATAQPR